MMLRQPQENETKIKNDSKLTKIAINYLYMHHTACTWIRRILRCEMFACTCIMCNAIELSFMNSAPNLKHWLFYVINFNYNSIRQTPDAETTF